MRRFGVLIAVLALGACSALPFGLSSPPPPIAAKPSKPARKPAATGKPAPEKTEEAAQTPAKVSAAGFPPDTLVGKDEPGTVRMLGAPAAKAARPPANIWTYETPYCRLELSFYMDVASKTFRVLTVDVAPRGIQPLKGRECVAAIQDGRT